MIIRNLIQGSPQWKLYRKEHFNASDAGVMLGVSPYRTRDSLLAWYKGVEQEHDEGTQKRFANGHRFEALARTLAEDVIGEELFPLVGSLDKYSASFDGLIMSHKEGFEHKSMNEALRSIKTGSDIPLDYRAQLEQQLMVSGADRILFMASSWDNANTLIEEVHVWYVSDHDLRERIKAGWTQFQKDLDAYVPTAKETQPEAAAIMQLPAVVINVTGELSVCNLSDVTPKFDAFLAGTKVTLTTDEDFANGEATAKFSRTTAKTLKLKAKEVIDQIATVSEAVRTLELYAEKFDRLGLTLEKAVKEQKEAIKRAINLEAVLAFREHVKSLEQDLNGVTLCMVQPDFNEAMKGQRTIDSLHNKVNTELANAKIEADAAAFDLTKKLNWYDNEAGSVAFLFRDIQSIIQKPMEDFKLVVTTRIAQYNTELVAKQEAEQKAKAVEIPKFTDVGMPLNTATSPKGYTRPSRDAIIQSIADTFQVPKEQAWEWLRDMFVTVY